MHMKSTNFKTLRPNPVKTLKNFGYGLDVQQSDRIKDSSQSCRDGGVIFNLDSYSQTELKELKDKFILDIERILRFVKQIEARELELAQVENVGNSVNKTSKIIGQKRTMHVTPDRGTKRRRLVKTMEFNSAETRKVEAAMMRKCGAILEYMMKQKHGWVFNEPVDVVALGLRDYHQVVKRPMDLGTVKLKLGKGVYKSPLDFAKDVRLTFHNAMLYNRKGEDVHTMATVSLAMFDKLFDPAYEQFVVERQREIVKKKKFSKPVAQLIQSQVVVSSQRDAQKKPLQMHPQVALPKKICEEAAKKSVSKQERTVPEAKGNPQMKRETSVWEKDQLGLPLEELTQSQVIVSSQRDAEMPLQMHPQVALPKKNCKEAAKKSVSKQERTVPEAKENPQMKREMNVWEKDQLGLVLQDFAEECLDEILQIVAKRNSKMTTPDGDGEIELDVHALDSETMWDLHRFVRLKLKAEQNNKVV